MHAHAAARRVACQRTEGARRRPLLLLALLCAVVPSSCAPSRRPALLLRPWRRAEAPSELIASEASEPTAAPVKRFSYKRVLRWGERHANAPWFPWVLCLIGFLDPFTLSGALITPLLTLALLVSSLPSAIVLCAATSLGCWAGNFVFCALIGKLGVAAKLASSPQLALARDLLQKHGPLAAVLNTLFPAMPTIPLMVAAHALDPSRVPLILLALALGRGLRYASLVVATRATRHAATSAMASKPIGEPASSTE